MCSKHMVWALTIGPLTPFDPCWYILRTKHLTPRNVVWCTRWSALREEKRRERRNFYLKSNKMVNTTLANSLLRRLECSLTYIGETGRMLATRMKDHLNLRNPLTAVGEHCAHEHHTITKDSVRVLARVEKTVGFKKRKVREAIEIKIGQPAMNLSCIQGDMYYCESYKVDSETESRGLKSPAITRGA